jgi:hypothetical protein
MQKGITLLLILILISLACNMPGGTPTQDPQDQINAAFTQAAQTVSAALTAIPTPMINTPAPSATSDSAIATATVTPIAFPTGGGPTAALPAISVSVDTNCRSGPGKIYDRVGGLLVNQTALIYGREQTRDYWYIRLPSDEKIFCWVWGEYATIAGDTELVPVFTPPPSPTPAPNFEVEFDAVDECVGWYVRFKVKNTGGQAFSSFEIDVKDNKTDVILSNSGNDFDHLDGCLSVGLIGKVDPGKTAYIASSSFLADPDGHKIIAEITLCTLDNLKGICVKKELEFRP